MTLFVPKRMMSASVTNPPPEVGLFVPVDAVFPDAERNETALCSLLAGLSRDDALFICARLNMIVSGPSEAGHKERQQRAITWLCDGGAINRINQFARQHGGADRITMFFRGQLLELFRWIARYSVNQPGDGKTFHDPRVRKRLVQAALIASDLWSNRTYGDRFSFEGDIDVARQRALGSIRKGVEETCQAPHIATTLGRGWALFSEYFPRRYAAFEEDFRGATGFTVMEYFVCAAAVMTHIMMSKPEAPPFNMNSIGALTEYKDILPKFLALESQSPNQLESSLWPTDGGGYRSLRDRPILSVVDGRSIILDPVFFSEKVLVGPIFHLLTKKTPATNANELFGAYGFSFEDYTTSMLNRMYPPGKGLLLRRLSCNVKGRDSKGRDLEIDALLNDVTELVIFEIKAAWLREDRILSEPYSDFIDHLREKYAASPRRGQSKRTRAKGIAQLARLIRTIATGEWKGAADEFSDVQLIYPVLVVHDSRLDAPAYGAFLSQEFVRLLGSVGSKPRIAPLTVVTIDDLEILEASVDNFSFRDLLSDYTHACGDRVRSFHNFLSLSPYRNKMRQSQYLAAKAEDILDLVEYNLFPTNKRAE